jgi:hypothetical protein
VVLALPVVFRAPAGVVGLLGRPAVVPGPGADRDRSVVTGAADAGSLGLAVPHPLQALAVVV